MVGNKYSPDKRAIVDVVIPLYNKSDVIGRAVASVRGQSDPRWRLFIVDDGSAEPWVDLSADPRVRVFRQQNLGPGAARNNGARLGSAPFIAFLDADDEWEPDFLRRALGVLSRDPELWAVSTGWYRGLGDSFDRSAGLADRWEWSPAVTPREFKSRVDSLHSSAVIIRRDRFEQLGGYYESHSTYGEDSYLWAAVAALGSVQRIDEPLLRFHTDASTLSVGRQSAYPIPPLLTDWEAFRVNVADRWDGFFPAYLAFYARFVLRRSIREGRFDQVSEFFAADSPRRMGMRFVDRVSLRLVCWTALGRRTLGRVRRAII